MIFVSNSSSSSFIVICNGNDIDNILDSIAESYVDCNSEWYNPHFKDKNLLNLRFCTKIYQLLFLGNLILDVEKKEYSLEIFKEMFPKSMIDYKKNLNSIKNLKLSNASGIEILGGESL